MMACVVNSSIGGLPLGLAISSRNDFDIGPMGDMGYFEKLEEHERARARATSHW